MYRGNGHIVLRDSRTLAVSYQYDRSRKSGIWEGTLTGDMRRLERGVFFDAIALICASGTVIDLKITTYGETLATFKGTTRVQPPTRSGNPVRLLVGRTAAPARPQSVRDWLRA